MSDGLLDRLGLGAVAGLAIGVAVTSRPDEQRPLREFAREILAECLRLLEDPRLAAAFPALSPAASAAAGVPNTLGSAASPTGAPEGPPRRRRRTRAQIEADNAQAVAPPAVATPTPAEAPQPRRGRRTTEAPPASGAAAVAPLPASADGNGATVPVEDQENEGLSPTDGQRVNLNTATRGQLLRLPRIGAQAADRILAYREQNGPIRNLRQLRQAEVIPVAAARQIRELVRF